MTSKFWKWLWTSPPAAWALRQLKGLLIGALRQGPVPRHVAFVMDGNRRYARNNRIEIIEGHHLGFLALAKVGGNHDIMRKVLRRCRHSKSATRLA